MPGVRATFIKAMRPITAAHHWPITCILPGTILRSDVVGRILMKCLLSDMPELRVGLNDKVEDATFHQCVNLSTYEAQKVITFVPPDGEFELMK